MTHTPGIENAQNWEILEVLAILSNHKIHHTYLNLAVLLTYNHHCMMYYLRPCKSEYSTYCKNNFKPFFSDLKLGIFLENWEKKILFGIGNINE